MNSIPQGNWHIESVVVNDTTVVNNEGIQGLEILEDEWVIHPLNQRFQLRSAAGDTIVLDCNDQVYNAKFEVNGDRLLLKMSRPKVKETVTIEAIAITADVYSSF